MQALANRVVAYHFCQTENAPTCSVPEFVHSMASQLSQSPIMKPYYQLLVSNHKIRSRLTIGIENEQKNMAETNNFCPLFFRGVLGRSGFKLCHGHPGTSEIAAWTGKYWTCPMCDLDRWTL